MAEYIPEYPINEELINSQFVEVPNITSREETVLWNKYLDVYEAVINEKNNRFNGVQIALQMIIRWVTMNKSSEYYTQTMLVLTKTMQSITGQLVSESDAYNQYMQNLVSILKQQIELYEKYFDAVNVLERAKFDYALKIRGANRRDLHQGERFTGQDVLNYLNSLNAVTHIYDKNIQDYSNELATYSSNQYVKQAIDIIVRSSENKKAKHFAEIAYYQNLCVNHGARLTVQIR